MSRANAMSVPRRHDEEQAKTLRPQSGGRSWRGWWLVAAALLVARPAAATTIRLLPLDQLAADADLVLVGIPQSHDSYWQGTRIVTRYHVRVQSVWGQTGPVGPFVDVIALGGIVGSIGQQVAGATRLELGRSYVLFLHADTDHGGYLTVGMRQGVFAVDTSGPVPTVTQLEPAARVVGPSGPTLPHSLEALRRAVGEVWHGP